MTTFLFTLVALLGTGALSDGINNTREGFDIDLVYVEPDTDHSGLHARTDLGLSAVGLGDSHYFAVPIEVGGWGQPALPISVQVDTGSDDLWVYGSKCKLCKPGWGNTFFEDKLKFKVQVGPTIKYADGKEVRGPRTRTTVRLPPLLPQANVPIVVARKTNTHLKGNVVGILGLRRKSGAALNDPAWYHLIPGPVKMFGLYLGGRAGGRLTVGGVSPACLQGPLTEIDVVSENAASPPMWRIPFARFTVGNNAHSVATNVELDSGATMGWGPAEMVRKLYKNVFNLDTCDEVTDHKGNKFCGKITSQQLAAANDVRFTFGTGASTISINIEPSSLLRGVSERLFEGNIALKNDKYWLLGSPHMSNMYVLHTVNGNDATVALAQSRACLPQPPQAQAPPPPPPPQPPAPAQT